MRFIVLALVALAGLVPTAVAQAAPAPAPPNTVVRTDVITEVNPLGWRVAAVAIEYRKPINLGTAQIPNQAFTVTATINGTTAPRTVTAVYTSDAPELDTRGPKGTPGRLIIIELDQNDPNAGALVYAQGRNEPIPLTGAYAVRQTQPITDDRGRTRLPAAPYALTNQGQINPLVDDFISANFTDSANTTINFRLLQPQAQPAHRKDGFPLVVFLHGGGERGASNLTQITANQGAVAFARPERQASDPAYVLAAQVPAGQTWTTPTQQRALIELIDTLTASNPIDTDRIYVTGMSLGGIGTFDILQNNPGKFAAALPIAAAGDPTRMPLIKHVPIWATHSIDDPVVSYTNGTLALFNALDAAGTLTTRAQWAGNLPELQAEANALNQWAQAEANDSHALLTAFSAGTTPVNAHWSWVPTYLNDVMLDWLFEQDRQDRAPSPAATALLLAR
ncbi:phospholipase [Solirubrobacter sp. CPCC 204708]|uniref:Alpha/beta hydrolase-fold protein n=1 Tax=Solirubrobacter deserti TaxID=2282478 RepID=A0ABT4RCX6_9ACTN|nr:prolyl oligopeptidase family serine peptidase [Solirubrobacter deserti]MBE2317832.1 phospholipase [Solirubrobacter deserti]MDA0136391.1 alpha/beta hydrolase-fold protein [Solirubrobacter deserti]